MVCSSKQPHEADHCHVKFARLIKEGKIRAIHGVQVVHIYHDAWCDFMKKPGSPCNCDPEFVDEYGKVIE